MKTGASSNGYITIKEINELKSLVREKGTITEILDGNNQEVQTLHI